jgi:hypothetical protein
MALPFASFFASWPLGVRLRIGPNGHAKTRRRKGREPLEYGDPLCVILCVLASWRETPDRTERSRKDMKTQRKRTTRTWRSPLSLSLRLVLLAWDSGLGRTVTQRHEDAKEENHSNMALPFESFFASCPLGVRLRIGSNGHAKTRRRKGREPLEYGVPL